MAAGDRSTAQLGGAMAWWIWALAVTFVVFLFSVQTGYAIVNANVQKDVGLTVTQVATIAATYTWVFALFQFYGGALLDHVGSRKVLPASIALVALGVFVFANAKSFEMLLLSQVILAIGSCTGFVGAGYIGGQWFGMAKFSFMFGLVQVFAALTSALSQNAIEFALKHLVWRDLFNYVGVFGIALFVLGAIFIRNPAPVSAPSQGGVIGFLTSVTRSLVEVARIGHVWVASIVGALLFGVLLAVGVVWAPKLLMVRGVDQATAVLGSSMLWLGLAVGSAIVPWWSDHIGKRKLPIVIGGLIQFVALAILVYVPDLGGTVDLVLCFIFGFANASHMLAFSTAADVVEPRQIGTSAAIVNGIMFIVGGIMIARPGVRIDRAIEMGMEKGSMDLAQYAALPLVVALAVAFALSLAMRETYPTAPKRG
ncbi:MAG: MFS transporter [Burkholderiales bacterium]|nr:MFS transporter [Burkholderiales bacterium]